MNFNLTTCHVDKVGEDNYDCLMDNTFFFQSI